MKSSRHMAILKIIKENDVETQYDLARLLQENGYNVTQATVSRDIKLLNLIKVSETAGRNMLSTLMRKTVTTVNTIQFSKKVLFPWIWHRIFL